MKEIKNIDIMQKAADEKWWDIKGVSSYMSRHMHRNSPFETSSSCGNCDGACCEDEDGKPLCRRVQVPGHLEFSVYTDTLYTWLKEAGVPEDAASEIAYSDYCRNHTHDGYRLIWPSESMLKEQYPDLYKRITTPDEEVVKVITSYKGKFRCFGDLQDAVLKHYGLARIHGDTYHSHVYKQLELYWIVTCDRDHSVACG